jgi:hypothetical protein
MQRSSKAPPNASKKAPSGASSSLGLSGGGLRCVFGVLRRSFRYAFDSRFSVQHASKLCQALFTERAQRLALCKRLFACSGLKGQLSLGPFAALIAIFSILGCQFNMPASKAKHCSLNERIALTLCLAKVPGLKGQHAPSRRVAVSESPRTPLWSRPASKP